MDDWRLILASLMVACSVMPPLDAAPLLKALPSGCRRPVDRPNDARLTNLLIRVSSSADGEGKQYSYEFNMKYAKNKVFFSNHIIKTIGQLGAEWHIDVYVVGGSVRDLLLGRRHNDLDVVVVGDGPDFAQKLADRLKTSQVSIFKNFGTAMLQSGDMTIEVVGARRKAIAAILANHRFPGRPGR